MPKFNRIGPKNSHQKKVLSYDNYLKKKTELCVKKYVPKRLCKK